MHPDAVTNLERWLRDCELYDIIEVVNQVYALGGGQRNVRSRTSLKRPQGGSDVAAFAQTQNSFAVVRDIQ